MPRTVHWDGSLSIDEFCELEGASRGTWYNMVKGGTAPEFYFVGSRVKISLEALAKWRAERLASAPADYAAASERRRAAKLKADAQQAAAEKAALTKPHKAGRPTPKRAQPL